MADDNKVSVELTAKIDGLVDGMAEAAQAMSSAAEAMRESLSEFANQAHEDSENVEGALKKLGESVKTFFEFEYIKEGFELLHEGFEKVNEAF
jgi:hypothetical protein